MEFKAEYIEDSNIFYRMCTGSATEAEKEEWNKNTKLPEEISNKISESLALGYKIAQDLDNNGKNENNERNQDNDEMQKFKEEVRNSLEKITSELKELTLKVEQILN